MEELKKCPFCGGEASCDMNILLQDGSFEWSVECNDCGVMTYGYKDPKKAMEVWNRRVE